jgi:signal transduction histidine kinase
LATEASPSRVGIQRLVRLRLRLTIWYVATFGLIILLLGGGLFVAISHQLSRQLDDSLQSATFELIRAARIREMEAPAANGRVIDAVDELNIPDRLLYLLDTLGNPVTLGKPDEWIRQAARHAAKSGQVTVQSDDPDDKTLRLHAFRFKLASGKPLVAVAVADRVELENRYADLITAFAGVSLAALVLVAAGSFLLVRKSTQPIERSIEFMRRFMADAAHELRTPITVLRARTEVTLQHPRESATYVSALLGIEAEARRLGGIVDSLLVLARADAGERPLERERLFLDDIAIDAVGAAQVVGRQKGVEVMVDQFEEAPVVGDGALIRQLIMIVLDNAIKFTDARGVVRLRVAMRGGAPTFIVEDNGSGIKADDLSRIFQRFFRGESARSRSEGAGLGLSIASWIATEHGADVSVSSEPGEGTRVVVTFPPAMPS